MEQLDNDNRVLVAGFAQLPKGTPAFEIQKTIGCILIVNRETNIIEDATFTFIMDLTNKFIASLLIGKSIVEDADEIVTNIKERFIVPPQRAVIQSFLSAHRNYKESMKVLK